MKLDAVVCGSKCCSSAKKYVVCGFGVVPSAKKYDLLPLIVVRSGGSVLTSTISGRCLWLCSGTPVLSSTSLLVVSKWCPRSKSAICCRCLLLRTGAPVLRNTKYCR